MGKNYNSSRLVNGLSVDASGNVGIGGSPSGSYKLDVNGNSKVLNNLTISSTTNAALIAATNSTTGYTYIDIINNGASGKNYQIGVGGNGAAAGYANNLYFDLVGVGNIMTLTSGRNVGIGTTSPGYLLDVSSPAVITSRFNSTAAQAGVVAWSKNNTAYGYVGSAYHIVTGGSDGDMAMAATGNLAFSTGSVLTERMRITSGGYLKQKANGGSYFAGNYNEICNFNNTSGDINLVLGFGSNTNNISSYFLICADTTQDRLYIFGNGNVVNTNGSYGSISDIKLKENIVDATPKLDDLLKVKVRNYNLIGEETKQIGVIAQELEKIFPSMIDECEDFKEVEVEDEQGNIKKERISLGTTTKSVKYSVFVPMLIKAIQEQQAQIEELKQLVK